MACDNIWSVVSNLCEPMFDIKKASTLCDRLEKFERIKGEDNEKINYNGIEKIHFIKTRIYCFFSSSYSSSYFKS